MTSPSQQPLGKTILMALLGFPPGVPPLPHISKINVDGSFLPLQGVSSEIVLVIGWQVSMRMMALGMLLSLRLWVYVMASSCRGIWA
ncbi:hypothetical protein glysoja_034564 [Glycine soja]|uniref:Uncharacterized protein n=1 Tax=Glycine soja TaxID=3848 RepID=A0A0B2SHS4_GLYSO|nr:hypothetical protein glysoja_034564 [Glycine soja]